ncbi:serine protease [Viridibacterium curvum]|uniref:Serine protease n=1 Tax=Viridibacterium curvum TaxID=1101404 RepID=A0ABP9QJ99_9RHOO
MKLPALMLSCLFLAAPTANAMEPDQLFKQIAPSVWLVRTFDSGSVPTGSGSAVVVEPRRLITNCHVLSKAASFVLVKDKLSFKGKLEYVDLERDLCMVSVTDEKFDAPPVKRINAQSLVVGQRVVTLGNPRALEMTLSDGLISRLQYDDDQKIEAIQTSAPFSPGSSGGGLFDLEGRLLGITQRVAVGTGMQNLNFALPAEWLDDLPARSKEQLDAWYASQRKPSR